MNLASLGLTTPAVRLSARSLTSVPGIRPIADVLALVALSLCVVVLVKQAGGMPNSLAVAMLPIEALAAYRFGWRGGLGTAILAGVLFGPLAIVAGMPLDGPNAWTVRLGAFGTVGTVLGWLFDRQRAQTAELRSALAREHALERGAVLALARAAEAKDTDTGDHVRRVQVLSEALARETGMDPQSADAVGWSAMLHDIGKIHVPDGILRKPGPLTPDEWETMRKHTIWGDRILADCEGFAIARRIARSHHENFDGSGYPDGLVRAAIPLEARIVRVADAFDAMTSRRPYTSPRSVADALGELDRWRDVQFDPELVALMIRLLRADSDLTRRLERLRGPDVLGAAFHHHKGTSGPSA